jgi:DNA modification methylase
MGDDYRLVRIALPEPLTDRENAIIEELSLVHPREDIYFETRKDAITVHLHALDVRQFRAALTGLAAKHHVPATETALLRIPDAIEAIGSYGIKGSKRVFVGFDRERKVKNREDKERQRGVYFYARGHSFSKTTNPLPEEFVDQIICGDSEEILRRLPDNCVDLMFTSPPYNFGLEYQATGDEAYWESYFKKLFAIFDECIRVLKYGGRAVVNIQPLFSDYIPSHHIVSDFFMRRKMIWKAEILWEKSNYNCKYTAWGSWKSPSNPYLKYTWEFLEVFAKGTLKKEGKTEDADITAEEFKKWVTAKWAIAPERNMEAYGHPAMFPEELAYRVIRLFSFKGDVVLDPFNGVGTTSAVASRLGRKFIGIDISEEYCQKARQRLGRVQRDLALAETCEG